MNKRLSRATYREIVEHSLKLTFKWTLPMAVVIMLMYMVTDSVYTHLDRFAELQADDASRAILIGFSFGGFAVCLSCWIFYDAVIAVAKWVSRLLLRRRQRRDLGHSGAI